MSADSAKAVTKENAIQAFREYRAAVKLISSIHTELMQSSLTDNSIGEVVIPKKELENYRQARKHLEQSITLNPYFPEVYVFLANSYWEIEEDLDKVVIFYSKALELDRDYSEVISARGHVLTLLGRIEEAQRDLETLTKLDSEFADSLRSDIATAKAKREQDAAGNPLDAQ